MFGAGTIITAVLLCMALLVLSAVFAERKLLQGVDLTNNGIVYALSLGIFYSAWTYYGSVGLAARSGFLFFTFYLGATLSAIFWWFALRKMVCIKNEFRLTSIADFISARYGKSELVAAIITLTTIVGIAPYIALQLRAVRTTYDIIAAPVAQAALPGDDITPIVVLFMIIFTIVFGVRHVDPTRRHAGMVMAVAVESLIQLVFFLVAGIFVVYFVFNGFDDIFQQLRKSSLTIAMPLRDTPSPFITWTTYIMLAMSAVLFLPRQFHISVVELSNEKNIRTAIWLFPAYTFLTTLFMFPIAMAGLIKGLPVEQADFFVLAVPFRYGSPWISLLIFIGGFAAATSMIMISSMTLATMITLHLVLPVIEWVKGLKFLERHILLIKRLAVAIVIILGYVSDRMLGESHALVSIGIMSFVVAAQFAPALLGGIFWRRGNRIGAIWGLSGGILVWFYTILIPAFAKSGWITMTLLEKGPWAIGLLKPEAFFGLTGLHHIAHGTLWSLFFNITLYVASSLLYRQSQEERRLADRIVDVLAPGRSLSDSAALEPAIVDLSEKKRILHNRMSRFFDQSRIAEILENVLSETHITDREKVSVIELAEVVAGIEKRLAGAIGTAAAHRVLKESTIYSPAEASALQNTYSKILLDLKVTPEELTRKIDYFQEREKLLSSHAKELQENICELNKQIAQRRQAEEELGKHRDHLEELVKERTAQLVIAKERAEAASQAKTAFLTNMSHELRTPLNAVIGYAQVLRMRRRDDEGLSDGLGIIEQSGNHLLTLINDILDLSIIEAGRMKLNQTPIHVSSFLKGIANIIQLRAEARQLSFHMEIPDALPHWVEADETRLRQVLLNLLGNAVKYTNFGQVILRLERRDIPVEGPATHPIAQTLIYFEVTDTGVGIEQAQIDTIFQPFEQIRQMDDESTGSGLGLAISRQLVQLMGGQLHVDSEPGQGSVFWFEVVLPVPGPVDNVITKPEKIVTGYPGPRRRVLVADDIASNRTVLVEMLAEVGFEIIEAMDGQQAVQMARETQPDLILIDKRMPGLDGLEAARQIRQIEGLEKVIVFAVTASASEDTRAKCRQLGINGFLPKPVYWPRLAALLEKHMNIEWFYAPAEQGEKGEEKKEDMVPPSARELEILLEMARRGSLLAIHERAAAIELKDVRLSHFARRLRKLARAFDEKAVMAMINQYIEE